MDIPKQSNPQTELNKILEIIGKIAKISADGDYIFRGESQGHEKVCSSLYRKFEQIGLLDLGVETVQKEELEYAKRYRYTQETDEFIILTEIQHFGGKTNLLDFTTDYRIALFFACDSSPFKDGRIILQDKNGAIKDSIIEPWDQDPMSRVRVQKSVFVRPPMGFIEPDLEIVIPKFLKQPMLRYLEKEFDISSERIYPDLHGFVSSQDTRLNVYEDIGKGYNCLKSGDEAGTLQEKSKNYQKAVQHFTKAIDNSIQLGEGLASAYDGRGSAYLSIDELDGSKGKFDSTIEDFTEAIKRKSDWAVPYNNRGRAYCAKGEFENAVTDFNTAIELMPKFAAAHHNRGLAYFIKGDFVLAVRAYTEAVQLKPDNSCVYYDRGVAWLHLQEWEKAKADLIHARGMGVDIVNLFRNFYKNLANCERVVGIKLPEDMAAMLTQP